MMFPADKWFFFSQYFQLYANIYLPFYKYFRVVQKNLVFVVGLSPRLCDAETLRRHEYFGKFGKIHKVVINQSTSYVGSQVNFFGCYNFSVL